MAGTEADDAQQWVSKMIGAVRGLNYEGTFVYLHDSQLESLHIVHSVDTGHEHERLMSLNGAARVVNRDGDAVVCIMPDAKAVSVDKRKSISSIPLLGALGNDAVSSYYVFHMLGKARIAMRDAVIVGVIPKDTLRYGYRLYLDKKTALPLKTDLMNESSEPVEQVMFTRLKVELEPLNLLDHQRLPVNNMPEPSEGTTAMSLLDNQENWAFEGLPGGFSLKVYDKWVDRAKQLIEQFVFSDGLASISVYVEQDDVSGDDALEGKSNMGAINAWGGVKNGHQITVVGKVPDKTVSQVVNSMLYMNRKGTE